MIKLKPITDEAFAQADDFIFHLSDDQLKQWLIDYRKIQYNMGTAVIHELKGFIKPKQADIWLRFFAAIVTCFDSYEVDIPLIKKDEIDRGVKSWRARFDKPEIQHFSGIDCMLHFSEQESQPRLVYYIADKFVNNKYLCEIFDIDERAYLMSTIICHSFIINDTIKKYLPKTKLYLDSRGMVVAKDFVETKNKMYKNVDEMRRILESLEINMPQLHKDFNGLSISYDDYLEKAKAHSMKIQAHLYTMAQLETKMSLGLDETQTKSFKEITDLSTQMIDKAMKAINDMKSLKESLSAFDKNIEDCMANVDKYMGKADNKLPDPEKGLEEYVKLDNIYQTELKKYTTLKNNLPILTTELEKVSKLLTGIMN